MTRPPPLPPTTDAHDHGRCIAPADLTAFVVGEGDDATRGAIARHVFGCATCRARRDAEQDLVGRLAAFADLGAWEEDLAAADLARTATARARGRGALAGAVAAAVLAAAVVGLPFATRGPAVDAAPATAVETATPGNGAPFATALLEAQAPDGRWQATTGLARHDVGATGPALLALLDGLERLERLGGRFRAGPPSQHHLGEGALSKGPVARAIADGVRWLAPRADDPQQAGDRERAVAAAALQRVFEATRDRAVGAAADRARRALAPGALGPPLPAAADVFAYVRVGPREVASAR